jgi:hypothetical protein
VLTVSAGVLTVAAGVAAAGGALTVSAGALTAAAGAAAAAEQCVEIMCNALTAMLFSAVPFCAVRFTSWPTYALRSVPLVVILKILPVLSSATV